MEIEKIVFKKFGEIKIFFLFLDGVKLIYKVYFIYLFFNDRYKNVVFVLLNYSGLNILFILD